jgi:2-methylcitrate dehydratase PrpD
MKTPLETIHSFSIADAPPEAVAWGKLLLLDLIGIAAGGSTLKVSKIMAAHAASQFGGEHSLLFTDHKASASGAALSAAMTIDALDGHDGFNMAKGHVGCALIAGILAQAPDDLSGTALLEALILGYELGSRLGPALHATAPDYHTSGAWMAVVVAAIGARLKGLSPEQTAHAVGIAEFHGPRSQMMRVIDHPTMLKDGSSWGAMAGVSAVDLAQRGFTGAPAITLTQTPAYWDDFGTNWLICQQYIKPYPVCRWAHAPVEASLALKAEHSLTSQDITTITVETFHESVRLASHEPKTTEEAQYSTSFPLAIALTNGEILPADLDDDALNDPEVLRLSRATRMVEHEKANALFPARRIARVTFKTIDGRKLQSDWFDPKWDAANPATRKEMRAKYDALAVPILGSRRAQAIARFADSLPNGQFGTLRDLLTGAP